MSKLREQMKSMLSNMVEASTATNNSGNYWNPTVDSQGNGSAILRFLPQPDLNKLPYVTVYKYYFTHPVTGKVYNEMSARTFGQKEDPMSEYNAWLWKNGNEEVAKKQKQSTNIYANCYVVRDPGKPENEGKVMTIRYGTKIADKIKQQLVPEFPEDPSINVFDLFEGKNLRMKIKNLAGFRNYDDSIFDSVSPVAKTDEEVEAIFAQVVDLDAQFLDQSKNRSYDDKLANLINVFGSDPLFNEWLRLTGKAPVRQSAQQAPRFEDESSGDDEEPMPKAKKAAPAKAASSSDDDIDDILASLGV